MKKIWGIVLLALTGFFFSPRYYPSLAGNYELKLYLGQDELISAVNTKKIVIGNPEIADVSNITKEKMTITPKSAGKTMLVFWDNFGEQHYDLRVFAENTAEIKRRVDNLLSKLKLPAVWTQAEEEEEKVLLLGDVKNPQDREKINLILGPLKEKLVDLVDVREEETIVEIDVQVLEIDKDATSELGFTNPLGAAITMTEVGSPGISAAGAYWTKLFRVVSVNREAFSWSLAAMVQEGKARILSRPRLACQSGKEAELLVGGEKPIFTTEVASAGGAGSSVEYKEYGLKLKIKPVISAEGRIKVSLNVDITEVQGAETIGSSSAPTAKAYPLTKRSASTELFVDNGETLAIGGLIKQKREEDVIKTPWLGDLPLVGFLFRHKTTRSGGGSGERGDTELFITLTPTIISGGEDRPPAPDKAESEAENKAEQKKEALEITVDTAAPAAAAAELPAAGSAVIDPLKNYIDTVQRCILNNMTYPLAAQETESQGSVKLSLCLSRSGSLQEVTVKSSSGDQTLDDNAVTATKNVSYPPFPSEIAQEELIIDVPVDYRLD